MTFYTELIAWGVQKRRISKKKKKKKTALAFNVQTTPNPTLADHPRSLVKLCANAVEIHDTLIINIAYLLLITLWYISCYFVPCSCARLVYRLLCKYVVCSILSSPSNINHQYVSTQTTTQIILRHYPAGLPTLHDYLSHF